ncbi:MAG TPA: tetratricopeptide repeat protein [Nodularia sp. (in: cyanobacteria)]|nr:tetratricopeptide repeat protein [Nodularia sp. (in: cyanobacteria)]
MKFTFSKPSVLAYASSILLLGFSIPLFAQIPASNAASECKTLKPPYLNTVNDFIGLGHFKEDCKKDSQFAVSYFTQAIRLNLQGEEAYYHRANAYYNLENYQAAVADYNEVIRKSTGRFGFSSGAYWNRARAYEQLGEKQKAISDVTQLIGDSSSNADEYLLRGNLYKNLGNKESANADYKAAEKLLQQYLNGDFGNGLQDPRYQVMLENVRNELAQIND